MFNEHEISLLRVAVRLETMLQDGRSGGRRPDMEELNLFVKYVQGKVKLARTNKLELAIHPLLISAVVEVLLGDRDPDISVIAADDPRAAGMFGYSARLPPHSSPSDVLGAALAALRAGTRSAEPAAAQSAEESLTPSNIAPRTMLLRKQAEVAAFKTALSFIANTLVECIKELQICLDNISMLYKHQQLLYADTLTRIKELEEKIAIL
ncbi:hypothetical protein FA95DRAFT_1614030 [Auriscalpium vulgare]|uniref:Uncharacterized protein n=1 Tax=Auriscalpium vulgare TaxID=40419 RepID=A0ACB8R0H4_9AGAM|nr:hypothetical protein FA95DRAFT_1614030 [Auriscalpium vulgare]